MEPPPPPSICSSPSPWSPTCKRRPGLYSARAVARPGSPPVIPDQYAVSFLSSAASSPSLQALHAYQCHLDRQHALTNVISLILDTGASISVSNCFADFVSPVRPVQHTTLKGIAAGLTIKGIGTVRYCVSDDQGVQRHITIPGVLFVPDCPSRLLCPRQLLTSTGDPSATMAVCTQSARLRFSGTTITVPYHGRSFLPILYTVPFLACYMSLHKDHQHTSATPAPCQDPSPPLTAAQRVKLHWHRRLNHANFDQVTAWMRAGTIPVPKKAVNAPNPVCAACNYGKAERHTHRSSTGVIGASHQSPGAGVSADQLEAGCPGLLPTTKGSPTKQR